MKQCCDYLRGIRYKLSMIGILCGGPTYIEGDNQSILVNTTVPYYTLNKRNQMIACHLYGNNILVISGEMPMGINMVMM